MIPLFLILVFSLRLKGADRVAGFSFAALFIAHELFLTGISAPWYCASDAAMACFLVTSLVYFRYSKFIIKIMVICVAAIVLDFTGLVMWNLELPVEAVDYCFLVLYFYACGVTINEGGNRLCSMGSVFRVLANQGCYIRGGVFHEEEH